MLDKVKKIQISKTSFLFKIVDCRGEVDPDVGGRDRKDYCKDLLRPGEQIAGAKILGVINFPKYDDFQGFFFFSLTDYSFDG